MKVKYKHLLQGYSGHTDDMIYYMDKRTGRTLARKAFKFKDHPGQPAFRTAQRNIYALKPSDAYKHNLLDYCMSYSALPEADGKPLYSWCHVYNRLMWAMQRAMPESVDLKTITREQISSQSLPCRSLKDAIDAGLLPAVPGYERFNKLI